MTNAQNACLVKIGHTGRMLLGQLVQLATFKLDLEQGDLASALIF